MDFMNWSIGEMEYWNIDEFGFWISNLCVEFFTLYKIDKIRNRFYPIIPLLQNSNTPAPIFSLDRSFGALILASASNQGLWLPAINLSNQRLVM
jgi:hypothetical protein